MPAARHKHAADQRQRRLVRRALLPALAAIVVAGTGAAVAVSSTASTPRPPTTQAAVGHLTLHPARIAELQDRIRVVSRSARRVTMIARPRVADHEWLTAPLNMWTGPSDKTRLVTVLPAGTRIPVTEVVRGPWAEIVRADRSYWVNSHYLAEHKPKPPNPPNPPGPPTPEATPGAPRAPQTLRTQAGPRPKAPAPAGRRTAARAPSRTGGGVLSGAPCVSGSAMEAGIVPRAVALHRAVCAHFPAVTAYGGWRGDGEHADGHAIDIMVSGSAGQAVADWVRANAGILHVDNVIWSQHIWTTQRSGEGWRLMPDRGSATANHYDHVHVRVF